MPWTARLELRRRGAWPHAPTAPVVLPTRRADAAIIDKRFNAIDDRFGAVDDRFQAMTDRIDALDQKMSRQFVWLVGIQITVLVAVVSALIAALLR